MFSSKMLSLPLLANEKIIKLLDLPDLLRFASCSSKTADLVRMSNIIFPRLIIRVQQNFVNVEIRSSNNEERVFHLFVNEKDFAGEEGFEWNGLGGLKFFESSVVDEALYCPEGPAEGELLEASIDSNSEESDHEADNDSDADGFDEDAGEESDENPAERLDENSDAKPDEHLDEVSENGSEDESDQESNASYEEIDYIEDSEDKFTYWNCKVSSPTNQSIFEVADLLITYLFDLFRRSEVHHMILWPTEASKQLIESHERLQKCETLTIFDNWITFISRPLSKELMEWLMDTVEAKDECYYYCYVIGEFKYERGFKTRSVDVEYNQWVHLNAILNSESETFCFYRFFPSSEFINTLLKEWISNKKMKNMKEIEWITLRVDNLTQTFFKRVMAGIPEATMTEEEHERIMPDSREGDGWYFFKVIRRTDGTLAEVFVDSSISKFSLVVY